MQNNTYNGSQGQVTAAPASAPGPQGEAPGQTPFQITPEDMERLKAVMTPENMRPLVKMFNAVLAGTVQAVRGAGTQADQQSPSAPATGSQGATPPSEGEALQG